MITISSAKWGWWKFTNLATPNQHDIIDDLRTSDEWKNYPTMKVDVF